MKKSITVNASQQAVWDAIISYRTSDPAARTVRSQNGEKTVIEEEFGGLPLVGSSTVVYEETETPIEQINFRLIQGDKLSAFDGAWILRSNGTLTEVELSANLDVDLEFPFKDQILNAQADKDMDKRLQYVKRIAEGA
jgi:hypothetical protein